MPIYYLIAEWIAFLCSILLLAKGVEKWYKSFFIYCLLVLLIEYYGRWLKLNGGSNHLLYNISNFYYYIFFLAVLYKILVTPRHQKAVKIFGVIFLLGYITNMCFVQGQSKFNSFSFIAGCILVSFSCLLYYLELLQLNKVVYVYKLPSFFIVTGLLIFCFLSATIYTLHEYFAYLKTPTDHYRKAFNTTVEISNVVLYLFLATAFILKWTKRKLSI